MARQEIEMKIAADTNVLVRAVVRDDPSQAEVATKLLRSAKMIAVAVPCLCEFVWVLRRVYDFPPSLVASAVRALLATANVEMNRPAVEAGLAMLDAGGDFADGAIAYEGRWLGAETFVSFDAQAVELLKAQGEAARLL
ncbi:MAG: type II toxin-antitoxin system VapC family toxin [Terriglobales bacterium]